MYPLLVLLLILNISLFTVNVIIPTSRPYHQLPLTDPDIPTLELVTNAMPAVYSSRSGVAASSCYTIGPYPSELAARQVMRRISDYGLAVKIRSLDTLETLNYLVYIPAQPTRDKAEAMVADMTAFNVKEHFIIADGPYKNAISLGFFDDMNKAVRHAEYIRYLGYDARYTEQKSAREVFWLDYDEPFGSNTPVIAWSKAVDSTASPQLIPRACAK